MSVLLLLSLLVPAGAIDPLAPLGPPATVQAPIRPEKAERVVRRGETITLRIRQGALTISTPARALGDAVPGERVRLMVTATRRTLDAVAEGPGVALLADR